MFDLRTYNPAKLGLIIFFVIFFLTLVIEQTFAEIWNFSLSEMNWFKLLESSGVGFAVFKHGDAGYHHVF